MKKYTKYYLILKKNVKKKKLTVLLTLLIITASFLSGILYTKITTRQNNNITQAQVADSSSKDLASIQDEVIKKNYTFKIKWGDLGKRMVEDGVIDKTKLAQALVGKDELSEEYDKYFTKNMNTIVVNQQNSQFWVDVLWGLGLANKNRVLEEGSMMENGDASGFASTGGWTLGVSEPMNYYSKYSYINLSDKQQKIVEEIAGNIYRPCCGNSTAFPDCNHGMAALGLIELMVSQNFSKDDIYRTVLAFNTYWFPQTYLDTAYFFKQNGRDYAKTSPKELLSKTFSSAMGAEVVHKKIGQVDWPVLQSGGSCGA